MSVCRLCGATEVEPLLDLGAQPLGNRFLTAPDADEATFPFALDQCRACGIIQIQAPVAADELRPRFDWITYKEAEGHLDELVDRICALPGITPASVVGAVSFKDDSTVERLQRRGFARTWRIDIARDLGVDSAGAGPETVQAALVDTTAAAIAARHGAADVLLVRHVTEHAQNPAAFVAALRRLVRPGGYLVFEVPDCGPALARHDYTMPWEEHVLYFTEALLRQAVTIWGLEPVAYYMYPYSHENSLVAIVRATPAAGGRVDVAVAADACATGKRYAAHFPAFRQAAHDRLREFVRAHGHVAVFGAGHMSCAWVNLVGARDLVDFVVDDHPKKRGLFMPGSRLPILDSSQLVARGISLCLLSLNQESETKVIGLNQAFLDAGGAFASIFPGRANSFVK